jgi:hypothetical protein
LPTSTRLCTLARTTFHPGQAHWTTYDVNAATLAEVLPAIRAHWNTTADDDSVDAGNTDWTSSTYTVHQVDGVITAADVTYGVTVAIPH